MCGIAGWIDWEQDLRAKEEIIEKMTETLYWRGPDKQGIWVSERALLGHRRLIVIDRDGGAQPMVFEHPDGKIVLTYNGEIYNFQELRKELEGLGHHFATRSDTEVVLRSYLEWGAEMAKRLNGIFAFAVWDERVQELLLVRDHLGVKPLFYLKKGESILFASEMKAILAHPDVKAKVGIEGLTELMLGMIRTPGHGIYEGIREVLPGHLIRFRRNGSWEHTYWQLESHPHLDNLPTTVTKLRELLYDIVKRQLVADQPVVSLLSGGLDSSGLAAIAAQEYRNQGKEPLRTFSVDFENSEQDFKANEFHLSLDTPWVRRVSEHAKTEHQIVVLNDRQLLDNLEINYRAHDLPAMGNMGTSLYLLFKEMKKSATVSLSGESADEVFGGYAWFHKKEIWEANTFPWMVFLQNDKQNHLLSPELTEKLNPYEYVEERYQEAIARVPRLHGEDETNARMREIFYLHLKYFLTMLLERKDRMSMATGLEVRVPFCDHRLVEYVWNIPWEMKCVDEIEKGILRRAFAEVLPQDVLYRRKNPYPATYSPVYSRALRKRLLSIIDDKTSPLVPLIDRSKLKEIVQGMTTNPITYPNITMLERFILLDAWLREYNVQICL
ncbi:asparagine synthase (glutamine-hydrolyzing) [Thermoactinomyces sp. CICC 10522]|uniref:asparagine synthase (glutamine-hydrolyzing) n=1 Tax=Thermoactinomyces sp. CICC 10522 TaxID=2767427 RepID=UPI0018DCF9A2|nr:asparagine synthase (glutamine-hydrolyzing) [Thermoactinomyces sp. CICC 10522]MBH8605852.1 asparagine synthase (glutamine-hydrolyzing) [Thermoactinomyces sp. CICC 10522]